MDGIDASLIVPTHDRPAMLPGLLASLRAQTLPAARWELLVVDDGSAADTGVLLREAARLQDLRTVRRERAGGAGAARNAGAEAARGRVLIFLDDDMLATPELVAAHVAAHSAARSAAGAGPGMAVIGRITAPPGRRTAWDAWDDRHHERRCHDFAVGRREPGWRDFYSGNCSVPRALFAAVGGFDAVLRRTEDLDLGYRLAERGARFAFAAGAAAAHRGAHDFGLWLENARRLGESEVVLARKHGGTGVPAGMEAELAAAFRSRRPVTRRLVRWCGGREAAAIALLHAIGRPSHALGLRRVSAGAYSAIHNLAYWQAVRLRLGPERFRRLVDGG